MEMCDVVRLALVLAVQADVEGMKTENVLRTQCGESLVYGEEAFFEQAELLRKLAYSHNDQL